MGLGWDGFVDFDKAQYQQKLQNVPDAELRQKETESMRRKKGSYFAVGLGGALSVHTVGASLISSGIAGRKAVVAKSKLEMIQAELKRRGHEPRKATARDYVIPITANLVGNVVVGGAIDISSDVLAAATPSGGSAAVALQPPVAGSFAVEHPLMDGFAHNIDAPVGDVIAGFTVEPVTELVLAQSTSVVVPKIPCPNSSCTRPLVLDSLWCDNCQTVISSGVYWHCCKCNDDSYDLCNGCFEAGHECPCQGIMNSRQYSLPGMVFHPQRHAMIQRQEIQKNLRCDECKRDINQSWYFACPVCITEGRGFEICSECYGDSKGCPKAVEHTLYSFIWAYSPDAASETAYQDDGGCVCTRCNEEIHRGLFYHCDKCPIDNPGQFDVCSSCYSQSGGCADPTHVLSQYNAFQTSVTCEKLSGQCDVPNCRRNLDEETVAYACTSCKGGENRSLAFCKWCYAAGHTCHIDGHTTVRGLQIA